MRIKSPPAAGHPLPRPRRAQDRRAMPAPIWLPAGQLVEYGGKPYGGRRGDMCRTASTHTFSDMNKQRPADGSSAKAWLHPLRTLGIGKERTSIPKGNRLPPSEKKRGISGGKLFLRFCFGFSYATNIGETFSTCQYLEGKPWVYICFRILEKSYDLTESLKLINISSFSRVFI